MTIFSPGPTLTTLLEQYESPEPDECKAAGFLIRSRHEAQALVTRDLAQELGDYYMVATLDEILLAYSVRRKHKVVEGVDAVGDYFRKKALTKQNSGGSVK